ncbi:hypothetical protein [Ottowia sp.]|uniref:hypothetical protein n=1 Tax=Ottowia sp. TaxID=1898956 RepID=UPI001DF8100C|nr:hypothetical protein [Ottowia sp.]MCB2032615.1 hypothetical protein [Ottowia sp.]MCO5117899.1 hypothetical protein [Burkholderiaceae bacterium]MCP5257721.1 hypothetical protein [Burkholderiaceae bacterium]HRW73592.1 hypothetical protein [Ottowia sp.]
MKSGSAAASGQPLGEDAGAVVLATEVMADGKKLKKLLAARPDVQHVSEGPEIYLLLQILSTQYLQSHYLARVIIASHTHD